ncbi:MULTISPECIES: DNA translocase FtsK [unclassified Sutcliffiella]|uniref:DNA translocase FtsK n=1 Tax=unclassified Sutcliffiella TaxID=2837532 RepID=UPI0030D1CAAE
MNWFKKLFAQLSEDEERTIEQDYAEKPGNKQKQANAKVAYQYPTGKFRFPLIPDEGNAEQPSKRGKRESGKAKQPSKPQLEQVRFEQKKENQKSEVEQPPMKKDAEMKKTAQPQKKFEKVVNENKQPFHPTEFVSPIFGYKPRPAIEKRHTYLPEIELTSKELPAGELEVTEVTAMETSYGSYQGFAELGREKEKVQEFNDVLLEENSTPHIVEAGLEEKESSYETAVEPSEESISESHKEEVTIAKDDSYEALLRAEHEPAIEENIPEAPSYAESAVTIEDVQPERIEERQKRETQVRQDSSKQQHIPFNVIMLKQDKRSLERKQQVVGKQEEAQPYFSKPSITMLSIPPQHSEDDREWVEAQRELLNETLHHFRVGAKVVKATQGPSVTQFEVQPEPGVKVNKITNLSDDIKLSLSARDIRMEAPIPGKNTIGIEVPNRVSKPVFIREIIRHPSFIQHTSPLTVALGLDISGQPVVLDLQKMPHGLIAGATGSGKSVCVNSIIMSLLFKSTPDEVKLLLIDPKMVELTPYNHIPHLVSPVITDVKAATAALKWAVEEMERRYELFVHAGVRDIGKYNEVAKKHNQETLPYMVIIIDELADLMMVAPSDVEEAICRIAQKARACGMHLLIATQRPSVDVITGLIKANIPTRIAFSVSSQVDSRTIIDIGGAERLLGRGDMLLLENGAPKPIRVQGNFVSDEEIERAVDHVRKEQKPTYLFEQSELLKEATIQDEDELFFEACQYVVDQNGASTSSLQRRFRIGYNRAARLMELMEDQGVISGPKGSKPRDVLVSAEELINMQDSDY